MAVVFAHQGRLWIVLDDENIERMKVNDPFGFDGSKAVSLALVFPLQITVAYAAASELPKIQALSANPLELVKYLARGFKVADSDHDRPYDAYNAAGKVTQH